MILAVIMCGLAVVIARPVSAAGAAYAARCAVCHRAAAEGVAGQFPRLAGRTAAIAQTPDGRAYLARVVLHGMLGTIDVDGRTITGLMPGMATMNDADIAEAINHALVAGTPDKPAKPFTATEIAAVRAAGKVSMGKNAELRMQLVKAGAIK